MYIKKCNKCGEYKSFDKYYKKPDMADGLCNVCNSCRLAIQKEYRRETANSCTAKYEKTHNGFIMRMYRNMKSRIDGVQKGKFHLYKNMEILPKDEFYNWVLSNPSFHKLFNKYKESGFDRKLAPSADRINSNFGYILSNMEIVTMSENSARGARNKRIYNGKVY